MGLFNILNTKITCPGCGTESETEIEFSLGLKNQVRYNSGDKIIWRTGKSLQNGGRPENGDIDAEGYAECPKCNKDFFVWIAVRNDVIQTAEVNLEKKGYIPDTIVPENYEPESFQHPVQAQ